MRPTPARALYRTLTALHPAPASQSQTPSTAASCSSWSFGHPAPRNRDLPPIRYHIFREPLPYPVGLKVQADIIDRRLAVRGNGEKGKGKGKEGMQDVLLLLGESSPYTADSVWKGRR